MRRATGVHMRASRHRIAALASQEGRKLAPSLKTEYRKELVREMKAPCTTQDSPADTPIRPVGRYKKYVCLPTFA
ncbi:hypothetical protein Aduo_017723 [Ancylostoma duodenale]